MAITPEAPGQISPPNTLTGEAVGVVAAPNTLTGEAVGTVAAPNTLTGEAVGVVAAPNTLTANAAGSVSVPNTLTGEAVGSVSAPNTLTANAAGSVSAPNTLTGKAVGSVSAPNTLVGVTPAAFPRTLTPLVDMNFATKSYAQSGTPVAFDDLFTYSRASSATFTNRVAKATGGYDYFLDTDYVGDVTNLVTYSEQFDNAAWAKLLGTGSIAPVVTANFTSAPDGTYTADKVVFDAVYSGGLSYIQQNITPTTSLTGSVWLKSETGQKTITLRVGTSDLVIVVTNEWKKFEFSASVGFDRLALILYGSAELSATIYIWGAQLTESVKPLPYVKTLNAPVTQTFTETLRTEYDPATGEALGALIEGGSTNLARYSEEFYTTPWSKSETSILTNTAIAPDGTLSADTLIPNVSGNSTTLGNASTNNRMFQNISGTYTNVTNSIYVKSVSGSGSSLSIYVQIGDDIRAINTVTVTSNWQRVEVSAILSSETPRFTICTEESVYIWGAQIEALPFASSYIRTEGAAVSRSADSLSVGAENISDQDSTFNIDFKLLGTNTTFEKIFAHDGSFGYYSLYIAPNNYALKSTIGVSTSGTYKTTSANERNKITGVYSYSDGTFSGYSGGDFVFVNSIQTFTKNNANAMTIGAASSTTQFTFGHISKFATYDKALTAQEITLL